eukprot:12320691-Prorocentrum_lima.AAC.1
MLDGIHALARLDDAMNGVEYTSVQVSVSDGMIPHRDANILGNLHGLFPRRTVVDGIQRRNNTSPIHSNRTRAINKGE